MELKKTIELKDNAVKTEDQIFVIMLDDQFWGFVDSQTDAQEMLNKVAECIKQDITTEQPTWVVEIVKIDDSHLKIKCVCQGYLYTSKWTAHNIKYASTFNMNPIEEPDTSYTPVKRHRRYRRRYNKNNQTTEL
jgi:hypothetical protein